MQYLNQNRRLGLTGLMRVMNDAPTLAQSIDSCVNALDELIITYNDCTDESPRIIEQKKQQYPDKIQVVPYPFHVMGIDLTDEEYDYVKSLPSDAPCLLASYYNNALQHTNFKYVMKIDADQIYFSNKLLSLRNAIVQGVSQSKVGKLFGSLVYQIYCYKRGNKRIWSRWHPLHVFQNVVVPLFREQYLKYVVGEFLNGEMNLSLSGVNVLWYQDKWCVPVGCKSRIGGWWPYNGEGDHIVFEADGDTYYLPWDLPTYLSNTGKRCYIERFEFPNKPIALMGFFWYHLKPMKTPTYEELLDYGKNHPDVLMAVDNLKKVSFSRILKNVDVDSYRKFLFNFVHNLDRQTIKKNLNALDGVLI